MCLPLWLRYTATKIPFMYSFSGNCAGLSPNFHIHVSVSHLYIPRIGPHISCSRIGRSIVGIYKSLTDTWMWKLGLRPRNSFSGYICFEFRYCACILVYMKTIIYDWKLVVNVKMRDLYIPRISPHISCSRIGRSIVGIYKSLTDTWM
jgi:hypothetical protein